MKLIKMTDFVLEQMNEVMLDGTGAVCARIGNYANFLNRPLELGMFFPCDENGKTLSNNVSDENYFGIHIYNEAKERVLFIHDCSKNYIIDIIPYLGTIEKVISLDLTLTESAKKQIGL